MSETDLQAAIVKALRDIDVWVIRVGRNKKRKKYGSATSGEDGSPDLWTELGWIEVKLPGEDLDPDQVTWHAKARRRGVRTGTAHSVSEAAALIIGWRQADRPRLQEPTPTVVRRAKQ